MVPKAKTKSAKSIDIKVDTQGPKGLTQSDILKKKIFQGKSDLECLINKETSDDDLLSYLSSLEGDWGLDTGGVSSYSKNCDMMIKNFGVSQGMELDDLRLQALLVFYKPKLIQTQLLRRGILKQDEEICRRISRVLECISNSARGMQYIVKTSEIQKGDYCEFDNPSICLSPEDCEDQTSIMKLCAYLVSEAKVLGYTKYKGDCYKQIKVDGHYTRAWEKALGDDSSIDAFVHSLTQEEGNYTQWKWKLNPPSNQEAAIKYLKTCGDPRFPELQKNRHVLAFTNGLYITKNYNTDTDKYNDLFVKYSEGETLPTGLVACKFFKQLFENFDNEIDWYNIPTPNLQCILDYQGLHADVCRWVYILIGRMLYEVGEIDKWQVLLFLKGMAASGKSTILLQVIKKFFEVGDVGILGNNAEKTFGISAFVDKFIFLAPEVKSDFKLDQGDLQSMISGEGMSINTKYKTASTLDRWKPPGAMAGNEVPAWTDNSGSVSRRAVVIEFDKTVVDGDMNLGEKLELEIPAILKKCNRGYLETVNNYGGKNLWTIPTLPEYFLNTQKELQQNVHSLENFLASGKVEYGPNLYCPIDKFIEVFGDYCRLHKLEEKNFGKSYYGGAFGKRGLVIEKCGAPAQPRLYPRDSPNDDRHKKKTRFIIGVDIFDEGGVEDCMI